MKDVSLQNDLDSMYGFYASVVRMMIRGDSVLLLADAVDSASTIVQKLFNDFKTRTKYFGRQRDDFAFFEYNLDGETDIESIDRKFLELISIELETSFIDLTEVKNYLESRNLILAIMLEAEQEQRLRYFLSYKFIFGENLVFLYLSQKESLYFENVIQVPVEVVVENLTKVVSAETPVKVEETEKEVEKPIEIENKIEEQKVEAKLEPVQTEIKLEVVKKTPAVKLAKKNKPVGLTLPKPDSSEPNLTARESAIYELLKSKNFVSRTEIAVSVWGEAGKTASDDAIDQVISRMRKKFVQAGFSKKYITSKKGEGVLLDLG